MSPVIPMIGKTFGRLTVTEFAWSNKDGQSRSYRWKCVCACGNEKVVSGTDLRQGNTQTCGCRSGRSFASGPKDDDNRCCRKCQHTKNLIEFPFSRQKKFYGWTCKQCKNLRSKDTPSQLRSRAKAKENKLECRDAALAHYGNKCVCCGEPEKVFLTFDHINGGGNQHRGDIKRQRFSTIGEWLLKNQFPDDFQILCFNCNWAKHANKICSHKLNQHVSMMSFGC